MVQPAASLLLHRLTRTYPGAPRAAVDALSLEVRAGELLALVGASGSTSTTIAFLYVLWRFPRFIKHVKAEGADPTVVVRLATFYNLNQVRVVFRFMFTLPLLVLALDGIVGHEHVINRNLYVAHLHPVLSTALQGD